MIQVNSEADYVQAVEKYSDIMYRVAYQNLLNMTDAEDAVQDTFLKLIRHPDKRFKDEEHLKAWLLRVTVNNCNDLHRRHKRHPEIGIDELGEEAVSTPAKEELSEELAMLENDERLVLYMFYYEGYTLKEIARILARKQNTVSSQLSRARKKLGEILKEEYAV